jgi:hypothetical protein
MSVLSQQQLTPCSCYGCGSMPLYAVLTTATAAVHLQAITALEFEVQRLSNELQTHTKIVKREHPLEPVSSEPISSSVLLVRTPNLLQFVIKVLLHVYARTSTARLLYACSNLVRSIELPHKVL